MADREGRGPAWNNSLFEDAAELGLGLRLGLDKLVHRARLLLDAYASNLPVPLLTSLKAPCSTTDETAIVKLRQDIAALRDVLHLQATEAARELAQLATELCPKSLWVIGGDGWAYDIGYGGLDHVLASGHNVKLLVLDTEVYSNTGRQQS